MSHSRVSRYEILLGFICECCGEKEALYRELLTFDLYLRENLKSRPDFAGEYSVSKEELNLIYEKEAEEHCYLEDYDGYDKRQLRKMTHIERFSYDVMGDGERKELTVLFDYKNRNSLTRQASIFLIQETCKKAVDGLQ